MASCACLKEAFEWVFFYIKWLISMYLSPISRITKRQGKKNDTLKKAALSLLSSIF